MDEVFSTWRPDSQVSRLGRGELTLAECDPTVAEVLRLGDDARVASGGAFDVWLPGADGVRRLDPSGVVKGWAVDRAVVPLLALAETDVCLSAGGDMVCHVADPDGEAWMIGIEHPLDPTRLVARVPVHRGAVATSGSAHRGAHVVDARVRPRPGRPGLGDRRRAPTYRRRHRRHPALALRPRRAGVAALAGCVSAGRGRLGRRAGAARRQCR